MSWKVWKGRFYLLAQIFTRKMNDKILCEQLLQLLPVQRWTSKTVDTILLQGDAMYQTAIYEGEVSDTESSSVVDLPNLAKWPRKLISCNPILWSRGWVGDCIRCGECK